MQPYRLVFAAALAALGACAVATLVWLAVPRAGRFDDMLSATVLVDPGEDTGSGTVLRACETYRRCRLIVLTNHHVVEGKTEVTLRGWIRDGSRTFPVIYKAKVTASDASRDLALLAIVSPDKWAGPVATLLGAREKLAPGEEVFAAGSALGRRPHVTQGLLSLIDETFLDHPHLIASAPVMPGSSGGSLSARRGGHFVMIGVPRAIAQIPNGRSAALLPNHAFVIPAATVRQFLHDHGLDA